MIRQTLRELGDLRRERLGTPLAYRLVVGAGLAQGDEFLDCADRKALGDDTLSHPLLARLILQGE